MEGTRSGACIEDGLPDVEDGVRDFAGERLGEKGDSLVFGLELSAVGHGVALRADDAVGEKGVAGAAVAKRAGGGEREGEFPSETGVGFADGGDIAFEIADDDMEGGVRGVGRAGEFDTSVALEGVAKLRGQNGAGLRKNGAAFDGLDVDRGEGWFGAGTEPVVGAAGDREERERGKEEREEAPK